MVGVSPEIWGKSSKTVKYYGENFRNNAKFSREFSFFSRAVGKRRIYYIWAIMEGSGEASRSGKFSIILFKNVNCKIVKFKKFRIFDADFRKFVPNQKNR